MLHGGDRRGGCHARAQTEVAVVDIEVGQVRDDVIGNRRAEADTRDECGELARRVGADREGGMLAYFDRTDIGFIDIDPEPEFCEILGHREQGDRLQRGGHGVARIDSAREHHAVRRGADGGFGKIDLVGRERRPGIEHQRAGTGVIGLRARQRCARHVELGLGRHFARRKPRDFVEPRHARARLGKRGGGLRDLGLRGSQRGLRAEHLVAKLRRVEFDEYLPLLDLVVDIDIDLQHGAREFTADVDGARGLDRAVGRDRQRQVAQCHGLRGVDGRCARRALGEPPPQSQRSKQPQRRKQPQ